MVKVNRGRPIDADKQQQQKIKLLDAALELLAEKSYRNITIRELAQCAEVNAAMVAYYFSNKEGLFIALLDRMSKQHFVNMKQVLQADNPIKIFIDTMLNMLCHNQSFARLVHDEFLTQDSALRDAFMERFPKRMAKILPKIIFDNTDITDMKAAKYSAFTLITMIITPFIGEPVRKQAWHISNEELKDPAWAKHIYQTFMFGCGKTAPKSKQSNQQNQLSQAIEESSDE